MERTIERIIPILETTAEKLAMDEVTLKSFIKEMTVIARRHDKIASKSQTRTRKRDNAKELQKKDEDMFILRLKETLKIVTERATRPETIEMNFDVDFEAIELSKEYVERLYYTIMENRKGSTMLLLKSYWMEGNLYYKIFTKIRENEKLEKKDAYTRITEEYGFSLMTLKRRIVFFKLLQAFPVLFLCSFDFTTLSNRSALILRRRKLDTELFNLLSSPREIVRIVSTQTQFDAQKADIKLAYEVEQETEELEECQRKLDTTLEGIASDESDDTLNDDELLVDELENLVV